MIKRLWVVLVCFLVAGCASGQVAERSVAMQSIEATRQAAGVQAEMDARAAVATQQAMETQMAVRDELSELQITAQVLEIERAERDQAHAEELAVLDVRLQALVLEERAAVLPLTQVAQRATATAIVAESMERVSQQKQADVLATLIPILLCVGGFAGVGVSIYGLYSLINVKVDRQRYIETSLGPVYCLPEGGWTDLMVGPEDSEAPRMIEARSAPQVWTSAGGSTAFSSRKNGGPVDEQTLVRNFLRNAAAEAGPLETQFPRWDSMGWHSDQWKRAATVLKAAGLVYAREREGTWVNTDRFPNIGSLSAAVHMKMVEF